LHRIHYQGAFGLGWLAKLFNKRICKAQMFLQCDSDVSFYNDYWVGNIDWWASYIEYRAGSFALDR